MSPRMERQHKSREWGCAYPNNEFSSGSAMLAEPRWFYDTSTQTFVMSFIKIDSSDYLAQTGIGTVKMNLTDPKQEEYPITSGSEVTITYIPGF